MGEERKDLTKTHFRFFSAMRLRGRSHAVHGSHMLSRVQRSWFTEAANALFFFFRSTTKHQVTGYNQRFCTTFIFDTVGHIR